MAWLWLVIAWLVDLKNNLLQCFWINTKLCLINNNEFHSRIFYWRFSQAVVFAGQSHEAWIYPVSELNLRCSQNWYRSDCSEAPCPGIMSCSLYGERGGWRRVEKGQVFTIYCKYGGKAKEPFQQLFGNGVYSSLLLAQIYYQSSLYISLHPSMMCAMLLAKHCWPHRDGVQRTWTGLESAWKSTNISIMCATSIIIITSGWLFHQHLLVRFFLSDCT